jgi:hypothetical protein
MKGCEMMISDSVYDILAMLTVALVAIHRDKVIEWERRVWAKFKRWLRRQLRKSPRIVAWAEIPTKHGRPDDEWITGQVKVWGDWQ